MLLVISSDDAIVVCKVMNVTCNYTDLAVLHICKWLTSRAIIRFYVHLHTC